MHPIAVVMNMFYTGLGIARTLGRHGIQVIGLTAHPRSYGNFTRCAKLRSCPDSREEPEALLAYFLQLAEELGPGPVVFPTRDDDVIFLERFRPQLEARFRLILPESPALQASLNKWATYHSAIEAGVAAPRSWMIECKEDLLRIAKQIQMPCVLKPISAHLWRKAGKWEAVGRRKAIGLLSCEELITEYANVAQADSCALVQEMISGEDNCLWIAACYMDRRSLLAAGFTARKLLQVPEGFGTGCIVEAVERPELLRMAVRLLQSMHFSGIAEVEFKWDSSCGEYKLIEINPRPWDQHRLGAACGVDLIYTAYCDAAGLPRPEKVRQRSGQKWIAEDVFSLLLLRSLWNRDGKLFSLLRIARGNRIYAIGSMRDPIPLLGAITLQLIPELIANGIHYIRSFFDGSRRRKKREKSYENRLENADCKN